MSRPSPVARPTLSVVVPAHNEANGIEWAIDALVSGLRSAISFGSISGGEVVVVDDHSTDATAALVTAMPSYPEVEVRMVAVDGPQGLGSAVRAGLGATTGDLVLYTDADLPFDPIELPRLLRPLDRYDADLVCGYRLDRTSEGFRRSVQSSAYNALIRVLLPSTVRDVNFACKVLRREVVDAVLPKLASTGSFIDAEILSRCAQMELHVVQIGVDYFPRYGSVSSLGGPAVIGGILREFRSLYGELRRR